MRVRMRRECPPGVLCLSTEIIVLLVVVAIATAGYFIYMGRLQQIHQPQQQPQQQQPQQQQQAATNVYVSRGGDDRYTRSPEPLRVWDGAGIGLGFSTTNLPFNIPTQGYPAQFTSVGIITTDDGQVLPLYGRQSLYNSSRYNYYTRTDSYNPVPLPLKFEKRDCMDDTGCDEIFNKDNVHISATSKNAKATIFKFDAPKYVP